EGRVGWVGAESVGELCVYWGYEFCGANQPVSVFDRGQLMVSLAELGRFAEAVEPAAEALRIAARTQHAFTIGIAHNYAGTVHLARGDWTQARSLLEHGVAVLRAANVVSLLSQSVSSSAWVLAQL